MKIEVKPKVVIRFLLIFWSCFFISWFFLKKLPEIKEKNAAKDSIEKTFIKDNKEIKG